MLVILHQETGVACSRNSPPSPPGRPSALLLHCASSEPTGVVTVRYKSIAVSLSTSTAPLWPACTSARSARDPRPSSVSVHTSAALGHPGRNSPPLSSAGFLRCGKSRNLEVSTPIRPFSRGSRLFPSFGSLILG
jgi:hypothetical protein